MQRILGKTPPQQIREKRIRVGPEVGQRNRLFLQVCGDQLDAGFSVVWGLERKKLVAHDAQAVYIRRIR